MTAIDDARPPVDLDLLADYLEGLLTGAEAQRVAELVASEPRWAATAARLRAALPAVHDDLLGSAEPMPPDVLDRVLAALAGTAAQRTAAGGAHPAPASRPSPPPAPGRGGPPAGPGRSAPPGRPTHSRRRRRLGAGVGSLVAIVVLLAVGTAVGIGLSNSGGTFGSKSSGTAAQAPNDRASGSLESWRNSIDMSRVPRTASGTDYGQDFIGQGAGAPQRPSPLGPQATGEPPTSSGYGNPDHRTPAALDRLTDPEALLECLTGLAAAEHALPVSVDYAYYVDRPALIVRLSNGATAAVGTACTSTNPDIIHVSGG